MRAAARDDVKTLSRRRFASSGGIIFPSTAKAAEGVCLPNRSVHKRKAITPISSDMDGS